MSELTHKKIQRARESGFTDSEIADAFRKKLMAANVEPERINSFLVDHGLVGTVTQQTFGKQLSSAFRGFGRDIASGVASGATLAKAGTGPAGQALSLPMSYVFGSAGAGAEDIIRGEDPGTFKQEVSRYHQAGMKSLMDELAGGPIAKMFGGGIKPFAKKMAPQDIAVAQFAKEKKLPMSVSSIFESKPAKAFEWVGDALILGKMRGNAKRKQLSKNLQKLVAETTKDLPGAKTDVGSAGEIFAEAIKEAKVGLKTKTSKAYTKFGKVLKEEFGDAPFDMENFVEVANKYRGEIEDASVRQYLAMIGDRTKGMTGKELDMFQKQIWDKTYKKYPWIGGELWEAIERDLELTTIWPMLRDAKDANILQKSFFSNPTVKTIVRTYARGDSDRVILNAFRAGNIEAVNQIKKAVSKEAWDVASTRFVQNIVDAAIGSKGEFLPAKFLKNYSKYRIAIKNVMPEIGKKLDMLSDVLGRSIEDIGKIESTKEGGALRIGTSLAFGGGGITSMATGATGPLGTIAFLVPEGFSLMLANSLRSPKSLFKKWLTTGFKLEGTEKMLRLGGRFLDIESLREED